MAATGPKRSLFSKPSWATTSTSSKAKPIETTQPSIFDSRVYEGILEAERKRKEEDAEKVRESATLEAERRQHENLEPRSKKQRISGDLGEVKAVSISPNGHRTTRTLPSIERSANGKSKRRATSSSDARHAVIQVENDEKELDMYEPPQAQNTTRATAKPKTRPPIALPDSDDDDDDYTRELKRKARERTRLQAASSLKRLQHTDEDSRSASRELKSPSPNDFDTEVVSPAADGTEFILDDPLIRLLITPRIPNSNPLIVNRRASQNMEMVKRFWCKRHGLDEATSAKVILTWRGTRLWNSSTMQGPLRQLKRERPDETFDISKEDPSTSGEQKGARIELEAMTEEQYADYLSKQERDATTAAKRATGSLLDASEPNNEFAATRSGGTNHERDASADTPNPDHVKKGGPILTLLCKDREPFKLRVKPDSTVAKVMRVYRQIRRTEDDENKTPWLTFDGERLEPDMTIQSIGIEDGDAVEVYFR